MEMGKIAPSARLLHLRSVNFPIVSPFGLLSRRFSPHCPSLPSSLPLSLLFPPFLPFCAPHPEKRPAPTDFFFPDIREFGGYGVWCVLCCMRGNLGGEGGGRDIYLGAGERRSRRVTDRKKMEGLEGLLRVYTEAAFRGLLRK